MITEKFFLQLFAEGEGVSASNESNAEAPESENESLSQKSEDDEFEELIKGKYSSAFAKRTQSIIDKRFAKLKESEKNAGALKPLAEMLRAQYPDLKNKPISELVNAFLTQNAAAGENAEQSSAQNAHEPNENAEQSSAQNAAAVENAEQSSAQNAREPNKNTPVSEENGLSAAKNAVDKIGAAHLAGAVIKAWEADAEKVKSIYPDFSLRGELTKNPEFKTLLKAGVPLLKAYECANLNKIMAASMRYAAVNAGRKMAVSMQPAAQRPQENGVLDRAASFTRANVNSLTEKDIMSIIDKVSRGAKITFR